MNTTRKVPASLRKCRLTVALAKQSTLCVVIVMFLLLIFSCISAVAQQYPSITTATLANGRAGCPYWQQLSIEGGTPPYRVTFGEGSRVTAVHGLSLQRIRNTYHWGFGGKPKLARTYSIVFKVTDYNNRTGYSPQYALTINTGITLSPPEQQIGYVGAYYCGEFKVSDGQGPFTFAIESHNMLQRDLKLDSKTGRISGVPTERASRSFQIKVEDANRCEQRALFNLQIDEDLTPPTLTITPTEITFQDPESGIRNVAFPEMINCVVGSPPNPPFVVYGSGYDASAAVVKYCRSYTQEFRMSVRKTGQNARLTVVVCNNAGGCKTSTFVSF